MVTDSFIQALRRSMARQGKVRSIRSGNGTNFVGTDNELIKVLEETNQKQIRDCLARNGTDWITWHKNHLVLYIWVGSGSTRFEMLEVSLLLY